MKYRFTLFCAFIMCISLGWSQDAEDVTFDQGTVMNFSYANRGFSMGFNYFQGLENRQWVYSLDMSVVKDLRETQIDPFLEDQGNRFIYGKINHLLVVSPAFGIQGNLAPISPLNIVQINGGIKIGPAIGFLNPYQIEVLKPVQGTPFKYLIEIEDFDPDLHAYTDIFGRADLLSSRIDPNVQLGVQIEAFAYLDFITHQELISGLEFGLQGYFFANPVPIMAEINGLQNKQAFLAVSLGLIIGRWW